MIPGEICDLGIEQKGKTEQDFYRTDFVETSAKKTKETLKLYNLGRQ
jgi:hypothetical protein